MTVKPVTWFKIGKSTYRVRRSSTCRHCGKKIVLGSRLQVWLHEDRITEGTPASHEAKPPLRTRQQRRSSEHGDHRDVPPGRPQ